MPRPTLPKIGTASLRPLALAALILPAAADARHSVARLWNEAALHAIRNDFPKPAVHARNLFHLSVAMYDAWAAYDTSPAWLLGNEVGGFPCGFEGVEPPADLRAAREEAISYAAYRLLMHRYADSPRPEETLPRFDTVFASYGHDPAFTSTDYAGGPPAALGNYIARCVIDFGLQDGANEENGYANRFYEPVNPPLYTALRGNRQILDPNRWQPLVVKEFIDQTDAVYNGEQPDFDSPEWGRVTPFSLAARDLTLKERDGNQYPVYHDPGPPVHADTEGEAPLEEVYKWSHTLPLIWSSHLDPADGVEIDVSPASRGNFDVDEFGTIADFPRTIEGLGAFYDRFDGRGPGRGRDLNPHTGEPYRPVTVPRGDFARVAAEFWPDGPGDESVPGYWYVILNNVSDHPLFEKRFAGQGPVLDELEWDVKAYLTLGGALHDAAVATWSIKGWYDYIRPIGAIRWMAEKGQSSDPELPRYSPDGLPLVDGFIETIREGDPVAEVAGDPDFHVGRVKVYTWKGPDFIIDPETDAAGVTWILAVAWWTYQAANYVTPPNAGYVSAPAAFSRAAAETMTLLTGDEFFPGGLAEFRAEADEFLQLENGPSVDVTLQWATYRDAADQASLATFWAGIQSPIEDIPGRLIGRRVGIDAFHRAGELFSGSQTAVEERGQAALPGALALEQNFPNPFNAGTVIRFDLDRAGEIELSLYDLAGRKVATLARGPHPAGRYEVRWDGRGPGGSRLASGVYQYRLQAGERSQSRKLLLLR